MFFNHHAIEKLSSELLCVIAVCVVRQEVTAWKLYQGLYTAKIKLWGQISTNCINTNQLSSLAKSTLLTRNLSFRFHCRPTTGSVFCSKYC